VAHNVTVGIENAYLGDGNIGEFTLAASLTQEALHLEDGGLVVSLGTLDRGSVIGHGQQIGTPAPTVGQPRRTISTRALGTLNDATLIETR
jgi:hypothetical protein